MSTNTPGLPNSPGQDFDLQKWAAAEFKSIEAQAAKETESLKLKWEKAYLCDIHDHEHQAEPPKKKKHRSLREKIKHFFKKVGQGIKNTFKAIGNVLKTLAKQMLSMLSMLPMLLTGPLGMIMGLGSMLMNAIMAIKAKAMLSKYMKESAAQTEQLKSMEKSLDSQLSNYIKEATPSSKSTSSMSMNSDIL